jgi:hypothetical protein
LMSRAWFTVDMPVTLLLAGYLLFR